MRREVQLKAAFSTVYPAITPERWYTAAAIAGLVKGTRILHDGPGVLFRERILDPAHFAFRGGDPRRGNWAGMRTRRVDRHPVSRLASAATGTV